MNSRIIWKLGVLAVCVSPLSAQEFADDERRGRDRGSIYEQAMGRYFEDLDRRRVKVPFEKGHRSTLLEYAPVVEKARASTAKVYKGDEVRALGTVVAKEGLIVTKASEIGDDEELAVELLGKDKMVAELVEVNEENDLALLWVHDFDLTPITWAPGSSLPVGKMVAAVGTLNMPLAVGAVSLPIRNLSEASKGFLGVSMRPADEGTGLLVTEVLRNSGAEKAEIEPGDVILAVDGNAMETSPDLINTIAQAEPGDVVLLQILREGEEMMVEVTLGDKDSGSGFQMPQHEMMDNTARMGGLMSRNRSGYRAAIQTDMQIRPNHCGGAMVNLDGEAVGLNIARASRVKSYAIPSEVVLEWLGDPNELVADVLEKRVANAQAARKAAEEVLERAIATESDVTRVLEELKQRREEARQRVEVVPAEVIQPASAGVDEVEGEPSEPVTLEDEEMPDA